MRRCKKDWADEEQEELMESLKTLHELKESWKNMALRLCTSVIMVMAGLLWVIGLECWVGFEVELAHIPRLCMKGVVISFGCRCTHM